MKLFCGGFKDTASAARLFPHELSALGFGESHGASSTIRGGAAKGAASPRKPQHLEDSSS